MEAEWLRKLNGAEEVLRMISDGDRQWKIYVTRLAEFSQFLGRFGYQHLLQDPIRLIGGHSRDIHGCRVGVGCFNSVWSYGKESQKGSLWLGLCYQAAAILSEFNSCELTVALIHHPSDWYVEYEGRPAWRREVQNNFMFCLHGHEHSSFIDQFPGHVNISAGACYERSWKPTGYNIVRVYVDEDRAECWMRRYETRGSGWVPDTVADRTDEQGMWPLPNLSGRFTQRLPQETTLMLPTEKAGGLSVASSAKREAVKLSISGPHLAHGVTVTLALDRDSMAFESATALSHDTAASLAGDARQAADKEAEKRLLEAYALSSLERIKSQMKTLDHEDVFPHAADLESWIAEHANKIGTDIRKQVFLILARVATLEGEIQSAQGKTPNFDKAKQFIEKAKNVPKDES
jgi:hypothetical protein